MAHAHLEHGLKATQGRGRLVAAIAIGLALAFLAAEGMLRALVAPTSILDPASDAYWRAHFRSTPRLADDIEHDARLGWRMRRSWNADGVAHDADGHRVTPLPTAVDPAKRPVVFLGDSFTYGLGVRDAETYAARFAARVPGRAVVNLAANGHGLDQQVLAFEAESARTRPGLVVVGYFLDDFRRNGLSFREAQKPHFVVENGALRLGADPILSPEEVRVALEGAREPSSYALAGLGGLFGRLKKTRGGFASDAEFERHADLSRLLLARLKQSTDAMGAKLVVLVIPHCAYDGYRDARRIEAEIEASCTALAIACIPTRAACAAAEARGDVVFGSNCHWSPMGHELAAKLLDEKLSEMGFER